MSAPLLLAVLFLAPCAHADPEAASAYMRLNDSILEVRVSACAELSSGTLRDPRAQEALSTALDRDPSDRVRLAAGRALATYTGSGPLSRLERALKTEPGPDLRRDLALALSKEPARLDDPESTRALTELVAGDPSPEVRLTIVEALGARGDATALRALRAASTSDPEKSIRKAAAKAVSLLSVRPRIGAPRPAPRPEPKEDAVKGKDSCLPPWGWCECLKIFKTKPACVEKVECRERYRSLPLIDGSFPCTWDGQEL